MLFDGPGNGAKMPDPPSDKNATREATLSRICEASGQAAWLHADAPLALAIDRFEHQPELIGIVIIDDAGYVGPLLRVKTFHALAQAFVRDLYISRPVRQFLKFHLEYEALELPSDMAIGEAIQAALSRDVSVRYDPLVVARESGRRELLDVRTLVNHQRCMLQDVLAEVDQQRREARYAAMHDRLTGLPNRPCVMEHLQRLASRHRSGSEHFAVLFLDFDRFKLINDSLGHDAGDALLVQISHRLREAIRRTTRDESNCWMAARLGGDEFLVVLDRLTQQDDAAKVAQSLVDAMQAPYQIAGYDVCSTPSIGVTTSTISNPEPAAMVRDADAAMYRAKSTGRSRFVVFDRSLHDQSMERLRIENDLRRALERNELTVFYQPIVSCEDARIVGFESLMRWRHPELGMVSPGIFIDIAEDSGLITPIGRFAIDQSLRQLADWRARFPEHDAIYMSINLSKKQALQPDTLDHLARTLDVTGVPAANVNLEVTETLVMDRSDMVVPLLEKTKMLGVKLSMDDFGTGTSSLTCLHQFPIDVLKIDRAFIQQIDRNIEYTAVVQAIATLARNLGMTVTVEGIERLEQLAQVQALECDYAQGHFFAKPMPADEAEALLINGLTFDRRTEAA